MKKMMLVLMVVVTVFLAGCDQWASRKICGDYTLNLPEGEKLVNVTWKESSIWYLTKPMEEGDEAETYKFQADSLFGVFEGTVTIVESE